MICLFHGDENWPRPILQALIKIIGQLKSTLGMRLLKICLMIIFVAENVLRSELAGMLRICLFV